jgi:inhibitor of KinA
MANQVPIIIDEISEDLLQVTLKEIEINYPYFFWQFSQHILKSNDNLEVVSGEDSLVIQFNPLLQDRVEIKEEIYKLNESIDAPVKNKLKESITVPVCYDDEFALDMSHILKHSGLSRSEVIGEHCHRDYEVKMIGFTPGFVYLGELSEKIKLPRLTNPRPFIPKGSIGIANNRTGIYPIEGPAGWSIIGRTPMNLFDIKRINPFLILPSMELIFEQITKSEFNAMLKD